MLTAKNPVTGDQKLRPKSARKPLQPKNFPATPVVVAFAKMKPNQEYTKISLVSNKENQPVPLFSSPAKIESFDASLAEELSAIKKKLERLRADREKTEKMLRERDAILDLQMKDIESRGEIQKQLEIEVDRLYRLNQLHSQSLQIFSPIRSLREKVGAKKATQSESKELKTEDREESVGESSPQELISSASAEIIAETK